MQNQQTRELIIAHLQGNAKNPTFQTLPDLQGSAKNPTLYPSPHQHSLTLKGITKSPILHPSNTPWPSGEWKNKNKKNLHPSNTPWPSGERKEPHPPPLKHSLTLREVQRTPLSTPSSGERKQPPTPTKTPQPTGSMGGGGAQRALTPPNTNSLTQWRVSHIVIQFAVAPHFNEEQSNCGQAHDGYWCHCTHYLPLNLVLEEEKRKRDKKNFLVTLTERCLTHKLPLNLVLEEKRKRKEKGFSCNTNRKMS